MNIRSLTNKLHHFETLLTEISPDIVVLTETWISNKITNESISVTNYEIVARTDRLNTTDGRGGGIVIYAKSDIAPEIVNLTPPPTLKNYQLCRVDIRNVSISGIYRSPKTTLEEDKQIVDYLRKLPEQSVITGDFNLPKIHWNCQSKTPDMFVHYQEVLLEKFWEQHVHQCTHEAGNVLDLVITNEELLDGCVEVCPELKLPTMDHYPIIMNINVRKNTPKTTEQIYDFSKADFSHYRLLLSDVNWLETLSGRDIEGMGQQIELKIKTSADMSIPKKARRSRGDPPWSTKFLKKKINQKKRARKALKMYNTKENREKHRKLANEVNRLVEKLKLNFEHRLAEKGRDQQKLFYSYMKTATKAKESIGPLQKEDGSYTNSDKGCAELLNSYFGSVFNKAVDGATNQDTDGSESLGWAPLTNVYFYPEEIHKIISKLKSSSSPGPDGISSRLLKEGIEHLCHPLSMLFNMSIQHSCVPSSWKLANVTPIFKGGRKQSPSNYRPISLTSQICKIMERLITVKLKQHLESNHILVPNQFGFREGKSCALNLLEFWNKVTASLEEKVPMDVIYFDFAKAFDKVPHRPLLKKLGQAGIGGHLLGWIGDWLSNREQRVVLNGEYSTRCSVTSSVPQGSALGPVLFLVYINDLCSNLTCDSYLFADDTKIAHQMKDDNDCAKLQDNIDTLHRWSLRWEMVFNKSKCVVLHFGSSNKKHQYNLNGQQIRPDTSQRDLGIIVDTEGKFEEHITSVGKKGNQLVGMVKRRLHSRDVDLLGKIYKTYILPSLTFASEAWNPVYKIHIDYLERVQRRFTRLGGGGLGYEARLGTFNLKKLETIRNHKDLQLMHQMFTGESGLEFEDFFKTRVGDRTRGESGKEIRLLNAKTNVRRHSYSSRQIHTWNNIPLEIRQGSVEQFKGYLTCSVCPE
jgi:ribonuclease P/MRP protein subunit RPP40